MDTCKLISLYHEAIEHTQTAAALAAQGDYSAARLALDLRAKTAWTINASCSCAPDWGSDDRLDAAALAFIKADRAHEDLLALLIDA